MAVKSIAAVATLAAILLGTSAIAHIPKSCHAKYNQQIKAAHYDVQSAERVVRKRLKKAGWSEDKEEMKKIVYLLLLEKKKNIQTCETACQPRGVRQQEKIETTDLILDDETV